MKLGKLQFDSMWMRIIAMVFVFYVITIIASLKGTPLTDDDQKHLALVCAAFLILDVLGDILKTLSSILDELKQSRSLPTAEALGPVGIGRFF